MQHAADFRKFTVRVTIFFGHPEASGFCFQSERVLYGRDLCGSRGTGKAEPAKLPGAGISPSSAREMSGRKRPLNKLKDN